MNRELSSVAGYHAAYHPKYNRFYFSFVAQLYRFLVPVGSRVLHVGCKDGYLLHTLNPSYGVGVDPDPMLIEQARNRNPSYTFYHDLQQYCVPSEPFDYILVSSSSMQSVDIQALFTALRPFCANNTRLIIEWHSYAWEPIMLFARWAGFFYCEDFRNRFSTRHVKNLLQLAGFEAITTNKGLLCPWAIPGISRLFNCFLPLIPGMRRLGMLRWLVARPVPVPQQQDYSVSVIVTCKNEKGNIEAAVQRCPMMGKGTELIFVEGHSTDGTVDEIERVKQVYSDKQISCIVQQGKGKADAVRTGFVAAKGDILMILDGDITVDPEELTKFYQALAQRRGDFINGTRLVYGMEPKAMRFFNLIANHSFSLIFSWIMGQRVTDTLCGTKVLFKRDYERLVAGRAYFGDFDPFGDFDLLFGAARLNCKIIDVPVHYKKRLYGTSQIHRWRDGWLLLKMSLFAIKKFKMFQK